MRRPADDTSRKLRIQPIHDSIWRVALCSILLESNLHFGHISSKQGQKFSSSISNFFLDWHSQVDQPRSKPERREKTLLSSMPTHDIALAFLWYLHSSFSSGDIGDHTMSFWRFTNASKTQHFSSLRNNFRWKSRLWGTRGRMCHAVRSWRDWFSSETTNFVWTLSQLIPKMFPYCCLCNITFQWRILQQSAWLLWTVFSYTSVFNIRSTWKCLLHVSIFQISWVIWVLH